jgi:hypothetical protein
MHERITGTPPNPRPHGPLTGSLRPCLSYFVRRSSLTGLIRPLYNNLTRTLDQEVYCAAISVCPQD